jgi:hypothetical protein
MLPWQDTASSCTAVCQMAGASGELCDHLLCIRENLFSRAGTRLSMPRLSQMFRHCLRRQKQKTACNAPASTLPQAGSDEVGTGDYFGPVCVCATIVTEKTACRC